VSKIMKNHEKFENSEIIRNQSQDRGALLGSKQGGCEALSLGG